MMKQSYRNPALAPEERARLLLGEMTLREKVGQLNQRLFGFRGYEREGREIRLAEELVSEVEHWGGLGVLYGLRRADPWSARTFENGLEGDLAIRAYNEVQRCVIEHSRHGIPVLMSEECPHGHQALDGYLLPVNLALGATWNPELVGRAFGVCAEQLAGLHVDLALVSMLDILRDPRWGRSEECYSEDPYLAASLASAVVKSFTEHGVDVVAKHCAAQGETTGGVNASAARIGEREVREIHLPALKAAVRAGAMGVMAAYNEIDGVPCHANPWLLRQVLRDEYGFTGLVMSDGGALDQLSVLCPTVEEQAAAGLRAGVDVSLWDRTYTKIEDAVESGAVEERLVDEAVLRVLTMKFRRGLFEHPYIEETEVKTYSLSEHPETLETARESVVLLKNEKNLLPLKDEGKIAVIGPFAGDPYAQLGDYTAVQRDGAVITVRDGVNRTAKHAEIRTLTDPFPVDPDRQRDYIDRAAELARECDTVLLTLGGSSSRFQELVFAENGAVAGMCGGKAFLNLTDCGEGVDVADLNLPEWQLALLDALHATGKPIVTVLIAGRPYAMDPIAASSEALLCAFYPGPAGGQAIAEILFGKIAPSGRLPVSLPRTAGQIPVYYNHRASYTARYSDCPAGAAYPFGFGLSYVPFAVCDVQTDGDTVSTGALEKNGFAVSFTVRNDGNMDAIATPQLYLRDRKASVMPRVRMLKGFVRIPLHPQEEKRCTIRLTADDCAVWNREMQYVTEPGVFDLFLTEGGTEYWRGSVTLI